MSMCVSCKAARGSTSYSYGWAARARQHSSTRPFEGEDHLRRDDAPSQLSARRLEDGVGVGLVQPEGHWDAPVQHLEHLVLDVGEQGHIDVEDVVQDVAELCRDRARWLHETNGVGQVEVRTRYVGQRTGRWAVRSGTCHRPRPLSREVLHVIMLAPSSIGRTELARNVVGCKISTRSTQA